MNKFSKHYAYVNCKGVGVRKAGPQSLIADDPRFNILELDKGVRALKWKQTPLVTVEA